MEDAKLAYKKGLAGIKVIQTNCWLKRVEAFNDGRAKLEKNFTDTAFVAGLMLYWAEGSKTRGTAISNSDPQLIFIMSNWFQTYYGVNKDSLVVQMHLHSGQNIENMRQYWSRLTSIPLRNFLTPYIKPPGTGHRTKKLYYGTVKLRVRGVGSTYMLYEILGAIAQYNTIIYNTPIRIRKWLNKPLYAK